MSSPFLNIISDFARKNFLPVILGAFILGGAIAFFAAGKKINTGCVVAVNGQTQSDTEPNKTIAVDLSGAVTNPGIYQLSNGSRVGDLLRLGGGAVDGASSKWISKNLNLSKKLEDSSKVYIPFDWEIYEPEVYGISSTVNKNTGASTSGSSGGGSSSSSSSPSGSTSSGEEDSGSNTGQNSTTINVNTATSEELDVLPGIGPSFAERIMGNRPYSNFTEFESKSGLWKSTAEAIKNLISF